MIKLFRIDHRLLHGQVIFSWVNALGADCILVANDDVAKSEERKTILRMAKPAGVKLVMKSVDKSIEAINSGVTDKYKLMVIAGSVADAYKLAKGCPSITSINYGNTLQSPTTKQLSEQIYLEPEELAKTSELIADGVVCEIRPLAVDKSINIADILNS